MKKRGYYSPEVRERAVRLELGFLFSTLVNFYAVQFHERWIHVAAGQMHIDGHFALATEGAGVVPVPTEYFELLEPVALLLLDTPVNEARRRLTARDGHAPPGQRASGTLKSRTC